VFVCHGCHDDAGWSAHCSTAVWHIVQYDGHCADAAIIADCYSTKYLRVSTELNVITQDRDWTVDMAIADRIALPQGAIGANLRIGVNENTAKMPDA
jgi:hypothetical protein